MPVATVNGVTVHYAEEGRRNAPAVIFIHGFPLSHEMWHSQIELLSRDFRVVAPDLRGHGKSDAGDGHYLIEFLVDDLIGLMDQLKIGKAALCGLSMGGYVALRALERAPERFTALVLCDTRSEADSNEVKFKRAEQIREVRANGVSAFGEGFMKALFAPKTLAAGGEGVDRARKVIHANSAKGIIGTLIALAARADYTAGLEKIKVPTLVLVGELDTVTPLALAENLARKITGAELAVIPGAGHASNLDNPDVFNRELGTFLGKKLLSS